MPKTQILQIRVDEKLKNDFEELLKPWEQSVSQALNYYMRRSVLDGSVTFNLTKFPEEDNTKTLNDENELSLIDFDDSRMTNNDFETYKIIKNRCRGKGYVYLSDLKKEQTILNHYNEERRFIDFINEITLKFNDLCISIEEVRTYYVVDLTSKAVKTEWLKQVYDDHAGVYKKRADKYKTETEV